jgi:hypothetical protein
VLPEQSKDKKLIPNHIPITNDEIFIFQDVVKNDKLIKDLLPDQNIFLIYQTDQM